MGVREIGRQDEKGNATRLGLRLTIQIASLARETAANPNEDMLVELRQLEQKMGLVLTLVRQPNSSALFLGLTSSSSNRRCMGFSCCNKNDRRKKVSKHN